VSGPYHQTYTDRQGVHRQTNSWYINVSSGGKRRRIGGFATEAEAAEAFRVHQEKVAQLKAAQRDAKLEAAITRRGKWGLRFEDLAAFVTDDQTMMHRRSLRSLPSRMVHLRRFFGALTVGQITGDRVARFIVELQGLGYANASINVMLAILKRGFALAVRSKKLRPEDVPFMPHLVEHNARSGFFELADFKAVMAHVPGYLEAFLWCCYLTGWRPQAELLTRQWRHVDFTAGWLRLDPGETKNFEGREFPLIPELRAVLERQRVRCDDLERKLGRVIPWLFFMDWGTRVTNYQNAWVVARAKVGMPHRIVYDLRRTAIRNLERAGVPRSAAMALVGHRTQSVYQRYAIVDDAMLKEAGAKIQVYAEAVKAQAPVVVPFVVPGAS
jgi:integrase